MTGSERFTQLRRSMPNTSSSPIHLPSASIRKIFKREGTKIANIRVFGCIPTPLAASLHSGASIPRPGQRSNLAPTGGDPLPLDRRPPLCSGYFRGLMKLPNVPVHSAVARRPRVPSSYSMRVTSRRPSSSGFQSGGRIDHPILTRLCP